MRAPPPLSSLPRFPIVGGVALLAIGATLAWWKKAGNLDALTEDPHIALGEVWRLATSALLHGNALHLLFNAYWLWILGTVVEERFGHVRTLAVLLLFAVGSGAAEYAVLRGGVGLSGVNYGLFGMLWALTRYDRRFAGVVDKDTVTLLVGWFVACIVATELGLMKVANIAHGVGLLLGWLLGIAVGGPSRWRVPAAATTALLTAAFAAGAIAFRPWVNLAKDRGDEEWRVGSREYEAQRYDRALKLYRQAAAMRPENPDHWHNVGCALRELGRGTESEQAFARADELRKRSRPEPASATNTGDGTD